MEGCNSEEERNGGIEDKNITNGNFLDNIGDNFMGNENSSSSTNLSSIGSERMMMGQQPRLSIDVSACNNPTSSASVLPTMSPFSTYGPPLTPTTMPSSSSSKSSSASSILSEKKRVTIVDNFVTINEVSSGGRRSPSPNMKNQMSSPSSKLRETGRPPLFDYKVQPVVRGIVPLNFVPSYYARLSILPEPLLQQILSFLQPQELGRISLVSKDMNNESTVVAEFCVKKILREVFFADASIVLKRLTETVSEGTKFSFKKFLMDIRRKRILVLNGTSKHSSILDLKKNSWEDKSIEMSQHRAAFSSVWYRGELVVISGNVPDIATGSVERYNPFTDTWHSMPSLPQRLRYASGAVLHNQLYVVGGFNKTTGVSSSAVYRYEPMGDRPVNNTPQVTADGVVIPPDMTSATGADGHSGYWNLIDIPLPAGRYTHAAVGFDGKIWVAGGFPKPTSVQVFDPLLGDWSEGPPLIVRRAQFKLLVCNGDLFAVGGDDATTHKTTIEKFDRRAQRWSIVTEFKEQRLMHSSTVAGSKIYIFGGMVSSTKALDTWDAFDVRTSRWDSDVSDERMGNRDDEYDDVSESDDYCVVGYDDDNDFDIDFEMTSTQGSSSSSTPLPPAQSGQTVSVTPPLFVPNNGRNNNAEVNASSASPSRGNDGGQIQVSVPGSLKRSLSSTFSGSLSNVMIPTRSSSFQTEGVSPSFDSICTPVRASSDGILLASNDSSGSLTAPFSAGRSSKRARRSRKKKRDVPKIERELPFTHAFGCAVTIPAISLYS